MKLFVTLFRAVYVQLAREIVDDLFVLARLKWRHPDRARAVWR